MIVHSHRQRFFRLILSDNVFIQKILDLHRLLKIDRILPIRSILLIHLFLYDLRADFHTLIANIYPVWTSYELVHLILCLIAEGASDFVIVFPWHVSTSYIFTKRKADIRNPLRDLSVGAFISH